VKEILAKLEDNKSFTYMAVTVLKSKLVSASILLLSSIIIIRSLPKEEYGLYVLILVFFSFFDLLINFIDASITRFIPSSGKKMQHQLVATVLSIKVLLTFSVLILFIFLYDFSTNALNISPKNLILYENLYLIVSLGFVSKFILTAMLSLLSAYLLYDVLFRLTIFNSAVTLFIALSVAYFEFNVWQYVLLTTIFSYIYALVLIYTFYQQRKLSFKVLHQSINFKTIKNIFKEKISFYSLPLLGVGLMAYVKNNLPNFILGVMVSLETLAVYSIFKKLTDFLHKGQASFIQGLYPRLFKMVNSKNKAVIKLYYVGLAIRFSVFSALYFGYEVVLDIYNIQQAKDNYLIFLVLISVFLTMYFATFFNLIIQSTKNTFTILKGAFIRTFLFVSVLPLAFFYFDLLGLITAIFLSEIGLVLLLILLVNKNYLFKKMLYSFISLLLVFTLIFLRDQILIGQNYVV
jgi:O-antigen/teichoic acid export membrane protein